MPADGMAGVSFELSEEQRMLRDMAHDFAANEIVPVADEYDRTAEFPWPIVRQAQKLGLVNVNVPEAYGGGGVGVLSECIIGEELNWGCSGIATAVLINNLAAVPIILAGTAEQKREWLGRLTSDGQLAAYAVTEPAAGSDVLGIEATATLRGSEYVLRGTKTFISNASVSDFYVIFVHTDKSKGHNGMSAFIVERETPGLSVSKKFDKMGQRASDTAEIVLDEVVVPAQQRLGREGDGFMIAMQVFDHSRPGVAAAAVGVARRAMEEAIAYARERMTFGRAIARYQGISFKVAEMAMNIEAARLLCWQAAWLVDQGRPNTKHAAFAKAFAADMCMQVCTDAVQVHGGYGYMKEFPVEKLMRDCKVFQIYEGTSEIQRVIIAREMLR